MSGFNFEFSESVATAMGVSQAPVAFLHNITSDLAATWLRRMRFDEVKLDVNSNGKSRSAFFSYFIGSSKNLLSVHVEVEQLMKIENDETWIGKYVAVKAKSFLWAYNLNWMTGKKENVYTHGEYPYRHIKPI